MNTSRQLACLLLGSLLSACSGDAPGPADGGSPQASDAGASQDIDLDLKLNATGTAIGAQFRSVIVDELSYDLTPLRQTLLNRSLCAGECDLSNTA